MSTIHPKREPGGDAARRQLLPESHLRPHPRHGTLAPSEVTVMTLLFVGPANRMVLTQAFLAARRAPGGPPEGRRRLSKHPRGSPSSEPLDGRIVSGSARLPLATRKTSGERFAAVLRERLEEDRLLRETRREEGELVPSRRM
ncbi:hypothetical protein KM043_005224 [Ampulex compressa]|nr:hypothetical protein KM043_005224 [Ampulex compressa]